MMRISAVEPRLPVADLQRSYDFYRKLAFRSADEPDDATEMLIVQRDDIALQLVAVDPHHPAGRFTLWLNVVDVQAEHQRLSGMVPIEWGPEAFSYGREEFAVLDPDGHRLIFSSPV